MTRRWEAWLDRYGLAGVIAGLVVFGALGALEDFGTPAGGEAWIFSACAGMGAAYLVSTVSRLRAGEGLSRAEPIPVTPRSYVLTVAMITGGVGVVWGAAVGPTWVAAVALAMFAVGWAGRAQLRMQRVRARRHAAHDGT